MGSDGPPHPPACLCCRAYMPLCAPLIMLGHALLLCAQAGVQVCAQSHARPAGETTRNTRSCVAHTEL
jgi:hypothetical protein